MPNPRSFHNAIAHIDCNAFFASVEQAYNPKLKGKPVLVTGMGGGCIIASSYEAKKFNLNIGTTTWQAKKVCPDAIIVPANFKRYQIYNRNLMSILSKYSPDIEPASIDECYMDLKGLRRLFRKPYDQICQDIKEEVKAKLGITVSIGLSTTKLLAKIASNYKKPDGLTVVTGKDIKNFLSGIKLNQVKGFGSNTLALLNKQGIYTPIEFLKTSPEKIKKILGKTGLEMQMELSGFSIKTVNSKSNTPKSLARTRSFKVTTDKNFIYQALLKNLTLAFWHLRRKNLKTSYVSIMLRTKEYKTYGYDIKLTEELNSELAIIKAVNNAFEKTFQPGWLYRSTGIITGLLEKEADIAPRLLPNELETNQQISLFQHLDQITQKHGNNSIRIARIVQDTASQDPLKRLYLPYIGVAN